MKNGDAVALVGAASEEELQYYKVLYPKNQDDKAMYLGKFRFSWLANSYTGEDDGVHLPVMRYSEILLTYAEALLRLDLDKFERAVNSYERNWNQNQL